MATDSDEVVAEYEVYLTESQTNDEGVYTVHFPNRSRTRPYNLSHGSSPCAMRVKPTSKYIEVDIPLDTNKNFDKLKALKYGYGLRNARELQNSSATFGMANGLGTGKASRPGASSRSTNLVATETSDFSDDLQSFATAIEEGRVFKSQTLGGRIAQQQPRGERYFVGAFRGDELHLTQVDGTIVLNPQFHNVDALAQQHSLGIASAAAAAARERGEEVAERQPRPVKLPERKQDQSQRDKFEDNMRRMLTNAELENWVDVDFVDEEYNAAYQKFGERLFVNNGQIATRLKCAETVEGDATVGAER